MIPRTLVLYLLAALAVLLVSLPVVLGGYVLTSAGQDTGAATLLWRTAMTLLMLIVVNLVLLVAAVALREVDREE